MKIYWALINISEIIFLHTNLVKIEGTEVKYIGLF